LGNRNGTQVLQVMEAAFILELLAGVFFAIAAVPLLRLAGDSRS
jgi:hypothetical protein